MSTTPGSVLTVVAVDLGASSGRVMLGEVRPSAVEPIRLHEVHRFGNEPVLLARGGSATAGRTGLHWNLTGLFAEVLTGLRRAGTCLLYTSPSPRD